MNEYLIPSRIFFDSFATPLVIPMLAMNNRLESPVHNNTAPPEKTAAGTLPAFNEMTMHARAAMAPTATEMATA